MMRLKPNIPEIRSLIFHWYQRNSCSGYLLTNEMKAAAKLCRVAEADIVTIWWHKLWVAVAEGIR